MMRVLFVTGAFFTATAGHAQSCRQALVLALDVSGSVNGLEYSQQVAGLAAALNHPDVRELILVGADAPVSLAVFEWSSRNHQLVILPWTSLDTPEALDAAIERIRNHRPVRAGLRTAMGTALSYASGMLLQQSNCWQQTIDISGDGRNNIGAEPAQVYDLREFDRVTVNALVIGEPAGVAVVSNAITADELRQYFEDEVIFGPQAFAIVANGYADYENAMRLKLMRELSLPMFGALNPNSD